MSRLADSRFSFVVALAVLLLGSSCAGKRWPGLRHPRDPGRTESPGEQPGESTPGEESGESIFVETSLPGERVELIGAPEEASYEFEPQPQRRATLAADDPAPAAPGQHPRLYFSANDLAGLQQKARSGSRGIGERIFAYGDKLSRGRDTLPPTSQAELPKGEGTWRKEGDRLMGMATAYALQTDPSKKEAYATWCVEAMRRIADWDAWGPSAEYAVGLDGAHILFGFSVAYDLLYAELNGAEQNRFAERIRKQASLFYEETQSRRPEFWTASYTNNHNYINHNALLNAALVVEGRFPEAKKWIQQCVDNTAQVMELRTLIADGSTNEGMMYGTYGSHALFATLDLLHEHRLADHFDNPWLTQHFNFLLHGSLPGFQRVVGIADGHGSYGHGPRHLLYFLDRVTKDGRPTWVAQRIEEALGDRQPYGKPEGSNLLFEILWHNPELEPVPITRATSPGFHVFEDWGVATFRRGWTRNDTFFSFRAGDPAGEAIWALMLEGDPRVASTNVSHSHPDAGSFSFYPGGRDFIAGALYPKPKRTALNNTYTFTPAFAMAPPVPEAAIERIWDPSKIEQIGRLDEVGQSGEWNQWMGPTKALVRERPDANLIAAVEEGDAIFVSGEIGGTYPNRVRKRGGGQGPLGLDRLYRSILLLPEDVMLIVDRVETRGQIATHNYFRAVSSSDTPARWRARGQVAVLEGGGATGSEVELVYPRGVRLETGQELISYEDAKGENRRSIRNWNDVAHSSVFARFSNPNPGNVETYIYLLRPAGKTGKVSDLQLTDSRGVGLKIETATRVYEVRIATDLSPSSRRSYLGLDGHVRVEYAVKD